MKSRFGLNLRVRGLFRDGRSWRSADLRGVTREGPLWVELARSQRVWGGGQGGYWEDAADYYWYAGI